MERLVQNVKHFTSAMFNGVSAVCSGVVATGLTSGLSSLQSFYLSPLFLTLVFYRYSSISN